MRFELFRICRNRGLQRGVLALATLCCMTLQCAAQEKPAAFADTQKPPAKTNDVGVAEYIVGAADVLDINVWKEPELSRASVAVRPDGMISMPLIGVIKVSGLTLPQIQGTLTERFKRYLSVAQVTVTVADIKSKVVYVTGEVNKPGVYSLVAPIGVFQLIIKAGGLTPFARSKSITVLRSVDGKQQKVAINYKKLLRGESPEQNIDLLPGDTVVVP